MISNVFMDVLTDQQLLDRIEAFIDLHSMAPTRFGREAMGDGALIQHLKAGRSPSLRNVNKIVDFMAAYRGESAAA